MFIFKEDVASVLQDAVELIDQHGWCQGTGQDDDGRFCVEGAVNQVLIYERQYSDGLATASFHAIQINLPAPYTGGLPRYYNDDPSTSVEDIKLLFKRSIEALEGRS